MREQTVPPLLPTYKFMCALCSKYIDFTDQLKKKAHYYGYDRKSKRPWIRLFHAGFDFSLNSAHSCQPSRNVRDTPGFLTVVPEGSRMDQLSRNSPKLVKIPGIAMIFTNLEQLFDCRAI